jgi:folylpolyglutamate synthase/dihydropteroate synthase
MLEEIVYTNRTTSGLIVENPIDAIKEASLIAKKEDIDIIILGSVYLVGDILNYIIIRDKLSLLEELRVH